MSHCYSILYLNISSLGNTQGKLLIMPFFIMRFNVLYVTPSTFILSSGVPQSVPFMLVCPIRNKSSRFLY